MKTLDRKLLRDLSGSWAQALAVSAVIMCGVTGFVTVFSAHHSLVLTRDAYFEQYRFGDFWVPLERAPLRVVKRLEALPGVVQAEGRIVEEVKLDVPGFLGPRIGRVISMPVEQGTAINDIHIVSGRYFSRGGRNQVIVNDQFARENRLQPGDHIQVTVAGRRHSLRIVATALSPEYVYMIRSEREFVPDPKRFTPLWLHADFAEMVLGLQGACTEIIGLLDPAADVDKMMDRLENLLEPYGASAAIPREDQLSNRYLSDEIRGLRVAAQVVPVFFVGIAAMILTAMLYRVVRRERTAIGVLKAYGYSNAAVSCHYLKYGLIISMTGGLLGFLLGHLLGRGMMAMLVDFFQFPLLRHRFYFDVFTLSLAISFIAGVFGSLWALRGVLKIDPADAMRPAPSRSAHKLILERISLIWRRTTFIQKMVLRDTFRYKLRSFLTVFGVMCSFSLLLIGFFFTDSMQHMVDYQFDVFMRQDVRIGLEREMNKAAFLEARRLPGVRRAEPVLEYPFTLTNGHRAEDVVVIGVRKGDYLMVPADSDGRRIDVGESGLVLSERLAENLGLKADDVVELEPLRGIVGRRTEMKVRDVSRQYLGMGAYMNINELSRLLDASFAVNAVLVRTGSEDGRTLSRHLQDYPAVATVEITEESRRQLEETLVELMSLTTTFIGLFAGVIAFAIIYNTTSISLTERARELGSLRVLGFTLGEIRRTVFGQNALLSAVGVALGLPMGVLLCRLVTAAYETDSYRLPFYISPRTYWIALIYIVIFAIVANLAAWRRINRLDMVEVLKKTE